MIELENKTIDTEYVLHKMLNGLNDAIAVVEDINIRQDIQNAYFNLKSKLQNAGYFKKPEPLDDCWISKCESCVYGSHRLSNEICRDCTDLTSKYKENIK